MLVYYACKELTIGQGRRVAKGQPVPEAASWSYPVLIAHLNQGWIEKREEQETTPEPAKAVEAVAQEITCPRCPGKSFKSEKSLKIHAASHDKRK